MKITWSRLRRSAAIALLHMPVMIAAAQTAAVLNGTVQDTTGGLIVNARVDVENAAGVRKSVKSTSAGEFRVDGLGPGRYTVRISADGFQDDVRPLALSSQTGIRIHAVLRASAAAQNVDVIVSTPETRVSTEPSENQNATSIERDALDRLPVFDEDYIATLSRFLSADATGTSGVTLVVNGVESNGPGVSASGVQSVKINQNPYTALYSAPGRARIEITTKGGTPDYHGSGNFLFRSSLFDAKNAFAAVKPPERRLYFEGAVTGPIHLGQKNSFLLTGNHDSDQQQAAVLAAKPVGLVQANVPTPVVHDFYSARAFHENGEGNQLWIGYSYERRNTTNALVGGFVLAEAGTNVNSFEHEINVGNTVVISPRMINQLRFLVGKADNRTNNVTDAQQIAVSGSFIGGSAQAALHRTESHADGADIVTYSRGKHEIKFGVDVPDMSRRAFDDYTNNLGSYTFGSLADYAASRPSLFVAQRGQPRATFWETVFAGVLQDTVRLRPNLSVAVGMRYYYQNYFHDVPTNLAPRASFAYAPSTRGHTILRGGAGLFYDRSGPGPISDLRHYDGQTLRRYIVTQPSFPYPEAALATQPTSVVRLDSRTRIPSTLQFSIGVEQQFRAKSTLSATYIGTRGMNQFRSIDANAPVRPLYLARPVVSVGQDRLLQSEGRATSNSLELSFRGRPSTFFAGQAQYILSKTSNSTQGIGYFPGYSYAPQDDWARSDNDRRHKFDLLGTFFVRSYFTLGTALSLYSGRPVNVVTGSDNNRDGVAVDRPGGTLRNSLHGPSYVNLDFNLGHDFSLKKDTKTGPVLNVSLNSFNVLNHRNATTYVGVITSPFFGTAVAALPPRRMQLNLQVKF